MDIYRIEDWADLVSLYPRTRIVRDLSADTPPDFVWQTLHQIASRIDGREYPAIALTYNAMGEHPNADNYHAFTGRAHVPNEQDTGMFKGFIWVNQWGDEPTPEPKYTSLLLHEYTHIAIDRRLGRQGHNKNFYRHLYRFAESGIVRGLSVREQWRRECHHADERTRVNASVVAAGEFGLANAQRSLRQRLKRAERAKRRDAGNTLDAVVAKALSARVSA